MPKIPRSFRFSEALVDDLEWLAERLRASNTAVIERAVQELRERIEKKAGKKSEKIPD